LQANVSQKLPQARWFVYEPVDFDIHRSAASSATSTAVSPYYKLEEAKVILSLDCDFVGAEEDTNRMIRGFARGRKISKPGDPMNRLYAVEGLLTLTGTNADHRLRVATSAVVSVAAAIASQAAPADANLQALAKKLPLPANVKPEWVSECAKDLVANKGTSLVLAGHRQPLAVHLVAHLLNAALGNIGKTVLFREGSSGYGTIAELAQLLDTGKVNTLV